MLRVTKPQSRGAGNPEWCAQDACPAAGAGGAHGFEKFKLVVQALFFACAHTRDLDFLGAESLFSHFFDQTFLWAGCHIGNKLHIFAEIKEKVTKKVTLCTFLIQVLFSDYFL
jgi:hypothetical protein